VKTALICGVTRTGWRLSGPISVEMMNWKRLHLKLTTGSLHRRVTVRRDDPGPSRHWTNLYGFGVHTTRLRNALSDGAPLIRAAGLRHSPQGASRLGEI